jgi:hypothetical protein
MKELNPHMITSALVELDTAVPPEGQPSPWLAGLNLDDFGGPDVEIDVRIARAAASLGIDILSPAAGTGGNGHGVIVWEPFTTKAMVDESHRLGMLIKPWTVNNLDVLDDHYSWGVDGTITDCKLSSTTPSAMVLIWIVRPGRCSSLGTASRGARRTQVRRGPSDEVPEPGSRGSAFLMHRRSFIAFTSLHWGFPLD